MKNIPSPTGRIVWNCPPYPPEVLVRSRRETGISPGQYKRLLDKFINPTDTIYFSEEPTMTKPNDIKIEVPEGFRAEWNEDGTTVRMVPVEPPAPVTYEYWGPEGQDSVFVLGGDGQMVWDCSVPVTFNRYAEQYSVFPTRTLAEKASRLFRRNNAIVTACLLIDPEFEPDWEDRSQYKWGVIYDYSQKRWRAYNQHCLDECTAYVSTHEKAKKVCQWLTGHGVK